MPPCVFGLAVAVMLLILGACAAAGFIRGAREGIDLDE